MTASSVFIKYSEEDSDYDPGDVPHIDEASPVPNIEYISPFTSHATPLSEKLRTEGKLSSSLRIRDIPPRFWGTIDIVNRYRSLKHPYVSGPLDHEADPNLPNEWITLRECRRRCGAPWPSVEIAEDVRFANDFMNKAIDNPKIHIDWGCHYHVCPTNMEHIELQIQ